jgi:serine/threonine-protein kinase RsbW
MNLPRDESTVPLVRHLVKFALWQLGVTRACAADIELAITEAAANVVQHAHHQEEYDVDVAVTTEYCVIRVIDAGAGFDAESLEAASASAEGGRGIELMRALVDNIAFVSEPEEGTIVHLSKKLAFDGEPPPPFVRRPFSTFQG